MRRFTLLFATFVIFAIATASVQKNLRYLGEEEERELAGVSDTDDPGNQSVGTTTPEVTTTTPSAGGSDGSESSDSSSPTESTTSESEATTSEPNVSTQPPAPPSDIIPTFENDDFVCYLTAQQYPAVVDNKFKLTVITCNLPDPVEDASTPETTTTPASGGDGRVLAAEKKITIGESTTSNECVTASDTNKPNLYTCGFPENMRLEQSTFDIKYGGNKTTVYIGCNVGKNRHLAGAKIESTACDDTFQQTGNYSGKCEVTLDGIYQIIKPNFYVDEDGNESEDYNGCNCTTSWTLPSHKVDHKLPANANLTIDGEIVNDFKPCKDGKTLPVQCTVDGWKAVDLENSGCQWNDGAIASTVSSVLLVLAVVFSIVF